MIDGLKLFVEVDDQADEVPVFIKYNKRREGVS